MSVFLVFLTLLGSKTVIFWCGGGRMRGGLGCWCEKSLFFWVLAHSVLVIFFNKKWKNILAEREKVVSLHPFSTRERQFIETDEKREIACVTFPYGGMGEDTKTSQDRFGGARAMWVYSHCRAEETRWTKVQKVKSKQFLQWRVWSWLRMNASGRLNTCKSRGSGV